MANDDAISARGGILPVGYPFGIFKKNYYRLTTGAATVNIFLGQLMDLDANGRAAVATIGSGATTIGPVVGFADTNLAALPNVMLNLANGAYLPGNTDAFVMIADDPEQDFVIQEDTGGTALTASEVGNNANWTFRSSSGNTTTGYSTAELDRSTVGTGTTGALFIKQLGRHINTDGTDNAFGNYAKIVVKLANHRFHDTAGRPTPV